MWADESLSTPSPTESVQYSTVPPEMHTMLHLMLVGLTTGVADRRLYESTPSPPHAPHAPNCSNDCVYATDGTCDECALGSPTHMPRGLGMP